MRRALAAALFFTCSATAAHAQARSTLSPTEEARVRQIVRDYLMTNPEVIEEALAALEARRAAERSERVAADPRHFSLGSRSAPFTIIEFFDYQCGYCHVAAEWVLGTARKRQDVRVVFVEFPILGPASEEASRAAIASIKQGKYVAFHRALMDFKGRLTSKVIDDTAKKVGIDVPRMRRDMRDPSIESLIAGNRALADEFGISGTPAFLVNGTPISGADFQALDEAIRPAVKGPGGRAR